jgi:hypothetical protein
MAVKTECILLSRNKSLVDYLFTKKCYLPKLSQDHVDVLGPVEAAVLLEEAAREGAFHVRVVRTFGLDDQTRFLKLKTKRNKILRPTG